MSAMGWSLCSLVSGSRRYERALGLNEAGFYWDSVFSGTADCLQNTILESASSNLHSKENVHKAWIALKQQYPLLGSRLNELSLDDVRFVVDEAWLQSCKSGEVVFKTFSSEEEVNAFANSVINERRILSNDLLACLIIIRRSDQPKYFHTMLHIAHCITDGISNTSALSTLLSFLSSGVPINEPILEERLRLAVASETLYPDLRSSRLAKRRWHRAIGIVLLRIRNTKLTGGHTLPRKWTTNSMQTPARSASVVDSFSVAESLRIIQNCRKNGLTFGNVYPVLGQIAMTRVLCRKYLSGQISQKEWEFRKREPMLNAGPINLRPYLDSNWYEKGGANNICVSISFFFFVLPYMPLGSAAGLAVGDDLPSFEALLSQKRFLFRCNSIKKQSADLLKHPRFLDMGLVRLPERLQRTRGSAVGWREGNSLYHGDLLSAQQQIETGSVTGHGGSSMGNMDLLLPRDYPIQQSSNDTQNPLLHICSSHTYLRCRPGELYLGASTSRQRLHLNIHWDLNVYDEAVVDEWFSEVKSAVRHYLGDGMENWEAKL
ncbi:hypothetical protein K435DRAFT_348677 [Dendrothele bispora CBS 962.96]|uniref:Condensation domain-containing protein n=1 Tax=Dendrothele bispora (strain CBS 962.96) TaxID=1314807 RepID=A0A4S8LER9_DENBC|nr:hypothetical protein K435DRAFT_348677 [Dendrothele bispora CBS 962.96]